MVKARPTNSTTKKNADDTLPRNRSEWNKQHLKIYPYLIFLLQRPIQQQLEKWKKGRGDHILAQKSKFIIVQICVRESAAD